MVLVLVATVVMVVVMDPMYPHLDAVPTAGPVAARIRTGARTGRRWWDWWGGGGGVGGGCSFCVVMGATRKSVYHQKRFHGSIFFEPFPPSMIHGRCFLPIATSSSMILRNRRTRNASWELFFIIQNERRPLLESLSAIHPSDRPPQW